MRSIIHITGCFSAVLLCAVLFLIGCGNGTSILYRPHIHIYFNGESIESGDTVSVPKHTTYTVQINITSDECIKGCFISYTNCEPIDITYLDCYIDKTVLGATVNREGGPPDSSETISIYAVNESNESSDNFIFTVSFYETNPLVNMELSEAVGNIPLYHAFLNYFINQGYEFWDFRTYWESDKNELPEKLLVIRHDVHHRDIYYAYCSYLIERELLHDNVATYFVMLLFPPETVYPDYEVIERDYLDIIEFLNDRDIDVQPHISPWDMYVSDVQPWWKDMTAEDLEGLVNGTYQIIQYDDGIEIEVTGEDVLGIHEINTDIMRLLKAYNERWRLQTAGEVYAYAAHGSPIPINYVINNTKILDQRTLLSSGLYRFDTYNTVIKQYLHYLSDNSRPRWIIEPERITPGRHQFLMHPYVWNNPYEYWE